MKNIDQLTSLWVKALTALCLIFAMGSCDEQPEAFELTDGIPSISYVRVPDAASSDSLLAGAYLNNSIAIIGQNLKSVSEMWFNDQKAVLNTSLMTDEVIIVSIPKAIPEYVTNKIYFINKSKRDTIAYDFNVLVPSPLVSSMKCEYVAEGDVAVINGNYFLPVEGSDDPVVVFTPNIQATTVVSHSHSQIQVIVPAGAEEGPVSVRSRYGTTRSTFYFRDTRGMILDWDNLNANGGWRPGNVSNTDPEGLSGNYVRFKGALKGDLSDWSEDAFSFNLWGSSNGRPEGNLFSTDPATSVLKFEINVLDAWKANAMQLIFSPWNTANNGFIADGTTPRALWRPWEASGSYVTDGWETITIPLKDFIYNHEGVSLGEMPPSNGYGSLSFFVYHGGVLGTDCTPHILLDNIRVVPQ